MAWALRKGRVPRTRADMALHSLEVLTGVIESGHTNIFMKCSTGFERQPMLPRGYLGGTYAMNQPDNRLCRCRGGRRCRTSVNTVVVFYAISRAVPKALCLRASDVVGGW